MASQDNYIEVNFDPYDDDTEHIKFLSELIGLYADFDEVYEKIAECINESNKFEVGSKEYVINKVQLVEYGNMLCQLSNKEYKIFEDNVVLLDSVNHFIGKKYGIPKNIKINTINIQNSYARKELESIKDDKYLLRLIASINFHKRLLKFNDEKQEEYGYLPLSEVRAAFPITEEDIKTLGLLSIILENSRVKDHGYFITLFSFTNPYLEYFYIAEAENSFLTELNVYYEEDDEEITDHYIPVILNILYTLQSNLIVDLDMNNSNILKKRVSLKDKAKILVNYDKTKDFYDSGLEKIQKAYKDNFRELVVLDAYLEYLYNSSDSDTISKLDKKLRGLSNIQKIYDKDFINPKIYFNFFRGIDTVNKKIGEIEKQHQRVRKEDINKDSDKEDDSE